ncbi:MAG: chloride channel protein [Candidatus Bathycorpusculaceae bacterium]
MNLNNEKLSELERCWFLPLILGVSVGLAIFAFFRVYELLKSAFLFIIGWNPLLIVVCPIVALLGGYFTVKLLAESKNCGCGTDILVEIYHHKWGFISLKDTLGRSLAAALTIGLGGSAGLEGPSLLLGGGLSSFMMRKLKLSQKDIKTMFLCGAAAGFSAIFKAPLTGILFALEIPYKKDIETGVFVPASIASVTAYFVSALTLGTETIFPAPIFITLTLSTLLHTTFLAVITALVALTFIETLEKTNSISKRLSSIFPIYAIIIVAGSFLGVIGLLYPETLGLGYEFIHKLVTSELEQSSIITLISILILKILATSLTVSFGGSGGLFIPALYVGGTLGLIYAQLWNLTPAVLYVMVAMAAMLAATSKSFLTSIALVAETVGSSFIILTVVSAAISYFITGKKSFYKSQLTRRP